jgi:hypothetical protein
MCKSSASGNDGLNLAMKDPKCRGNEHLHHPSAQSNITGDYRTRPAGG